MANDQTSFASDVELMALVPPVDNPTSERSGKSSAADLSVTRRISTTAAHPTSVQKSSLSRDPFFTQNGKPSIVRRLILDSWLCESIAMCFSVVCLVTIAFVVDIYDGERIPKLISGLTINAIISVLSTASGASLVFVISATMGQLKWCWLRSSSRHIRDIQAMDDASRGPLGALGVLACRTGGSLAALGSIVTLLMIAFSPFLQQIVEYPSRNTTLPDAFALAPRNLAYTHHMIPNTELTRVIEAGAWSTPKLFDREPICSTGQCSWPTFQSIGWCSKCENLTNSATLNNCKFSDLANEKLNVSDHCVLDLGHGDNFSLFRDLDSHATRAVSDHNLTGTRYNMTFTSDVIWPLSYGNAGTYLIHLNVPGLSSKPTTILDVRNPLIAIGHASVELVGNYDRAGVALASQDSNILRIAEASQCILQPCEKTLTVTKVNGTSTWNDDHTNFGIIVPGRAPSLDAAIDRGQNYTALCWKAEAGDLDLVQFDAEHYSADSSKKAFCPVEDYAYEIQKSLQGQYNQELQVIMFDDGKSNALSYSSEASDYKNERSNTVGPESTRSLEQRVESIATALTNWGLQTTNDTVRGDAIGEESYVHVRWKWIILPAVLELASLTLLVVTIIHSRREDVPLWKTSALALIYHGVDELRGRETLATERLSSMEVTAKTTDVQLIKSEDGVNYLSKRSGHRPVEQDG